LVTETTIQETVYMDDEQADFEMIMTMSDDMMSMDMDFCMTDQGGNELSRMRLVASEGADDMKLSLILNDNGMEPLNIKITAEGEDEMSLALMLKDMESGRTIADVDLSSTPTASSAEVHIYNTEAGEGSAAEFLTIVASGTNSGDDYDLDVMVMAGDMNVSVSGAEITSESGTMSMTLQVLVNMTGEGEGEVETFVNVSASGSNSGNDYNMSFSSTVGDLTVTGTVVDQYGTQDGLSVDAILSEGDAVTMKVDVEGTHSAERVDAVAKLLDGDNEELFKLDPLSLTYMSTCYSVHATVFADDDSTMTEMLTVGLALTNDSNEVHFDMLSLAGDMDIHMNVSFAEPMDAAQ
jgi:hypothetical protein